MADVLLTHGFFLSEDPKERRINKPYPTLGLLYVSAYLRRAGFEVDVFDTTFSDRRALEARFAAEPGGVVGFYTNLITRGAVVDLVRRARAHGWTVVVGGPESANYPKEYLERGAHVVVVGEGEETMEELLRALPARGPHRLEDVRGIHYLDEAGRMASTPPRPYVRDLDSLPWPDRERIDVERYVDAWRTHHGAGSVNLITARGCPYTCRWCSHAVFGHTHRRRSPTGVADELEHIVERYRPDQVWYADDVFTIHHRWLFRYAEELARRGLRIPFETITRADRMQDERVVATLTEMGCHRLWIGSESGSQRILDAMDRRVTTEEVRRACDLARDAGIEVGMFLMWGYEGETPDDVAATVEHVVAIDPDHFLTTVAYPIKDTPYFEEVEHRLALDGDWATSTDRDHRIQGRLPPEYFEAADAWLRGAVAARRLASADPEAAAAESARARAGEERVRALAAGAGV